MVIDGQTEMALLRAQAPYTVCCYRGGHTAPHRGIRAQEPYIVYVDADFYGAVCYLTVLEMNTESSAIQRHDSAGVTLLIGDRQREQPTVCTAGHSRCAVLLSGPPSALIRSPAPSGSLWARRRRTEEWTDGEMDGWKD